MHALPPAIAQWGHENGLGGHQPPGLSSGGGGHGREVAQHDAPHVPSQLGLGDVLDAAAHAGAGHAPGPVPAHHRRVPPEHGAPLEHEPRQRQPPWHCAPSGV